MKERIKSVGFWTGVIGAVFLILGAFGVEIGDQTASSVINAVCSLLVMFGIITPTGNGGAADVDCQADKTETENDEKE